MAKPDYRSVTIMGRRWRLGFVRLPTNAKFDGDCDPPGMRDRKIRIDRQLTGREKLRVLIHEALHAADWSKSERTVDQLSRDLARIIDQCGYRED